MFSSACYDLIFVSETWLDSTDLSSFIINGANYDVIRSDRPTHAGGVAVFFDSNLSNKINVLSINDITDYECIIFDYLISSQRSVRFICLYVSPQNSSNPTVVQKIIRMLRQFTFKGEIYILGDFNFSDYKFNINATLCKEPLKDFLIYLEEHSLHQLISSPTHIHGNILDLAITSTPHKVTNLEIINPLTVTCDHNMIDLKISANKDFKRKKPRLNFYKANYSHVNSYLSTINWPDLFKGITCIDLMYSKFMFVINEAIDLFVPLTRPPGRKTMPYKIRKIDMEKWALYRKSRKNASFIPQYKAKCKQYKTALRDYNKLHEQKILRSPNKKALFNHIKCKTRLRHSIPPLTDTTGKICLDPYTKATLLNNTFGDVFLKEKSTTNIPFFCNSNSQTKPQKFSSIMRTDILEAINTLKNSVSRTPDGIPSLFIKQTAFNLLTPLHIIFNHSLITGTIPKIWKKAIVIPIYKKGKLNNAKNYRPISLTSAICRLLERLLHNQIHKHLTLNNTITTRIHKQTLNANTTNTLHGSLNRIL